MSAAKNRIRIRLSKNFYNKEAIMSALDDFKEICKGKIINDDIDVELEPKEPIKCLKEEFSNYALGMMKNKMLV